ncbi:MAG: RNA polymerase sigma factor [Myxococcales bacterium]|nr:RNA polymerase sigma factor [Myxococcales bacterium]
MRRAGGPASSVPYLLRAIRSAWLDGRRGASRGLVDLVEHDGVVGPEAERLIEADALWAGLLTLSPIQREVLFLHLVEGWTTAEIGERTGTPTNTVQSHLRRGRESLQAWLTAEAAK